MTGTLNGRTFVGTIDIHEGAVAARAILKLTLNGNRLEGLWMSRTTRGQSGKWVMTRLGPGATPKAEDTKTTKKSGVSNKFAGTWVAAYNGGECTLIVSPSGSGTEACSGTGGQRENGSLTNCAAQGSGMRCDWRSTYSDADKTITRGGKKTLSVSGNTLKVESTVDQNSIVQNWRNNCPNNDCPSGAKRGGVMTYTRR